MPLLHRLKNGLVAKAMVKLPYDKMAPKVLSGAGSSVQIGQAAKKLNITKALIVTDEILMKLGVCDVALASLKDAGVEVVVYDKVLPDPTIAQVEGGSKLYLDNKCDGIVAIGGGSSMDCAKIIGVVVNNPGRKIREFAGAMNVKNPIPPLIACPTTHGTGSETTFAAVITGESGKFLISDFKIIPKVAVLDATLLLGLPKAVSAATALDAMTHAVEAYLSSWANDFARSKSLSSVKNLIRYTLPCYHEGDSNIEAREAVLQASFDAGLAISVGAVSYVHAIAHTLGSYYHTPHGVANAMLLPKLLDFYGDTAAEGLAELAVESGLGTPDEGKTTLSKRFIAKIRDMMAEMNMPTTVPQMKKSDIPSIATKALQEAHGETHSIFSFGSFMKDAGYPVVKYLSQAECERIVRQLLPSSPPQARL